MDSFRLREEPDGSVVELCPYSGIPFIGKRPANSTVPKYRIYEKDVRKCPTCEVLFEEIRNTCLVQRYVPLVIYNVPQKLDHPISLDEGRWGERNDDDTAAAA